MAIIRIIPVLLLKNSGLVKTRQFKDPKYIGDPINAVKIFNEKEVDEIIFLDILATAEKKTIQLQLLEQIAGECFMPLSYGGGIKNLEDIRQVLQIGVEKVILNTAAVENMSLVKDAVDKFGSSTICISIDVKKNFWGKYEVYTHGGKINTRLDPLQVAIDADKAGAGELMITSIDQEGTSKGYDLSLIKNITDNVSVPVIASGGAGSIQDLQKAVIETGVSAVAAGSMFVFQGKHRAVLITYPSADELQKITAKNI